MPNEVGFATRSTATWFVAARSAATAASWSAAVGFSIVAIEEREGESEREIESADGWGSGSGHLDRRARSELDWRAGLANWEWVREREKWVSELKKENRLWGKERMGEEKRETIINK